MVRRALNERALRDEVVALRQQLQANYSFQNVLSKNPRMLDVFELIGHIASTTATVLITGETGTGKEVIARAIHQASAQHRPGAMIALNCAAVPETLLESELFGHEKGSFTGARGSEKDGSSRRITARSSSTKWATFPPRCKSSCCASCKNGHSNASAATETIEIDVRVIAATNRSLEQLVKEGKFREDLFYRLNVITIELPPLRERPEDIALLAAHFTQKYARPGHPPAKILPEAMELLLACDWPGNIRQLENAIERASITARDGVIGPKQLPPEICSRVAGKPVDGRRSFPAVGRTARRIDRGI